MGILEKLDTLSKQSTDVNKELFIKHNVKRGLRNSDGTGVLVGLTNIGDVVGYTKENDKITPVEGKLYYRGIDVEDLVKGCQKEKRHGFDETCFLLLTGKLPTRDELRDFSNYLANLRNLPQFFVNNVILSFQGKDLMNMLAREVLFLYQIDEAAEDQSHINILKESLNLIAKFPVLTAYSYYAYRHQFLKKSLVIRHPDLDLTTAENMLYMLRGSQRYTKLEADILDLALILHAEHGGGNNSTFTTRVVSSASTDTYSAIAAAIGSLKGALHGGANLKVDEMMTNIKENVKDWSNKKEIADYLRKILRKEAFDGSGKIFGFGHAVYTVSDPRAVLLKEKARELADEKNAMNEFILFENIESLVPDIFGEFKGAEAKKICANVDFYSGLVYRMIDIPHEIFTPIFATARIAGWCAHRLEEATFSSRRIIRPAYKSICEVKSYVPMTKRT